MLFNIIMFTGVQFLVSGRSIYRLGRHMIDRKMVVRVLQLRMRIGMYVFSIYETGQLSTSPVSSSEITVGTEKGQRVPQVQIQRLI